MINLLHYYRVQLFNMETIGEPECMRWSVNGQLHRENGPAVKYDDGTKYWYRYGNLHRLDGPAIERADGDKEWWINGKRQYYLMSEGKSNTNQLLLA